MLDLFMNPSREYIKQLAISERQRLAEQLGVTPDFLYQIGAGFRNPGRELALKLELLTDGAFKESDFDEEIRAKIAV